MGWALMAGVITGVALLVRRLTGQKAPSGRDPAVGAVSEGWLATERGRGRVQE